MPRVVRIAALAVVAAMLLPALPASAAVTVDRATLSGTSLRVEGTGAGAGRAVTVRSSTSVATSTADSSGRWRVTSSTFGAPTCTAVVNDGTSQMTTTLAGCTPTATAPAPAPAPAPVPAPAPAPAANRAPVAHAGPDLVVADADGNGFEVVPYDGRASSDADGTITAYSWTIQSAGDTSLGTAPSFSVTQAVGTYTVVLRVTDDKGAQAVDTVVVTVGARPVAVPSGPRAVLESDQAWSGSLDSAMMGGSVASAGDVNGDGFGDVIVGAPGFDRPGGLFDEGAAYVFLGTANGVLGRDPSTAATAIVGLQAAAQLGTSVDGAGDVNGDGYDDIIVGAPMANPSDLVVSGAAYVFLGGPKGIVGTSPADAQFTLESKQIEAHLGRTVAGAGDVNADGFDDVIVGAEYYGKPFVPPIANQGSGRLGASFLFLGSSAGLVGRDPATAHASFLPWLLDSGAASYLHLGETVDGAGDVNGDGYDDVVIGASGYDNTGQVWPGTADRPYMQGAALLYYGGPTGISAPQRPSARIDGSKLESFFGASVSGAGDVNGDGYDDVVIGAPGHPVSDPLLVAQEGAAFVFHGGPTGVAARSVAQADNAYFGSVLADWVGRAVNDAGDTNGDGYGDVLIGARAFAGAVPDDAAYNGSRKLTGDGIAYLLHGSAAGLPTSLAAATRTSSGQEGGSAGYALAGAGDINGDKLSDVIVGVPGWSGGQDREGAAFVALSGLSAPTAPQPTTPPPPPPNTLPVADAGPDQTLVDVNGDGSELVTYDGSHSTDPDGTIVSWAWRVLETTNPLGNSSAFSVRQSRGRYTVELTVTDERGGKATDTLVVTIAAPPPAAATASLTGPATVRRGATITFTATVTNTGSALTGLAGGLTVSPAGRLKSLAVVGTVPTSLAAGTGTTISWRGQADVEGTGTATLTLTAAGGVSLTKSFPFTVLR